MKQLMMAMMLVLTAVGAHAATRSHGSCEQSVGIFTKGPLLTANVGNGCGLAKIALGYKKSGILNYADHVDVKIKATCTVGHGEIKDFEKTVTLRREQTKGNGFTTHSLDVFYMCGDDPSGRFTNAEFTFTAPDGTTDGAYSVTKDEYYANSQSAGTNDTSGDIGVGIWGIIVTELGK
ncbi:MAG: hypothetical protein WC204_11710 [Elusimicrobiales bacterium]|jgi:hypothetical protein